jgi:glycosyltransferase involved in cell wall biosynthesis
MLISIVVPTYRRPVSLGLLLPIILGQMDRLSEEVELIIVDNCSNQSAHQIVAVLAPSASYVSEPRRGIANARNAGTRQARGRYVIFIDDDQVPAPNWLASFGEMALAGYAACFGPVLPDFNEPPPVHLQPILQMLFGRNAHVPTGTDITHRRAYLGTGNSMFDRDRCFEDERPFEERFNAGGEDVWFLRHVTQEVGVHLIWCTGATVKETVPTERTTAAYVRRRLFRNGQLRCIVEAGGKDWPIIGLWMLVGILQFGGFGLMMLAMLPFDRCKAETLAIRAVGGLGKILWWLPAHA